MKNVKVENNIFIVARKSAKKGLMDYYMLFPDNSENYMFTRSYSQSCYEICKAGVPINNILHIRCRNIAIMQLSKYLKVMMPYFAEYFNTVGLATA